MTAQFLQTHFAVAVCAISGVLAGSGKRVDLFGVIVLGLVTALGGGTVRDIVLGNQVFWLADSRYVINGAVTSALPAMVMESSASEFDITVQPVNVAVGLPMKMTASLAQVSSASTHASPRRIVHPVFVMREARRAARQTRR